MSKSTAIRRKLATLADAGRRYSGAPPYGYRFSAFGGALVPVDAERRVIARILDEHAAGASFSAIAAGLNRDRVQARGLRWYPMTVARIVARGSL